MNTSKTLVITGGNSGIGFEITKFFLSKGFKVVVGGRNYNTNLDSLDKKKFIFKAGDVRKFSTHIDLVEAALKYTGKVDVWINNAGVSAWKPIIEVDETFFSEIIDINLKGTVWGCKAVFNIMHKTGGSIINISSIAGKRGSKNNSIYCASKFGVNGVTQSLAKEFGKFNINVNAICPVLIQTKGLVDALNDKNSPANEGVENFLKNFKKINSATGNLPDGKDVAEMAYFLSSNNSKSITGQCINVDCGVFPQ